MQTTHQGYVTICNRLGLHARATAKLVQLASEFDADIQLCKQQQCADAKSIISVMMLAASCGTELSIEASGSDSQAALAALIALVEAKFGESE